MFEGSSDRNLKIILATKKQLTLDSLNDLKRASAKRLQVRRC